MGFVKGDRVRMNSCAVLHLRPRNVTRIGTVMATPKGTTVAVKWDGSRAANASSCDRYSIDFLDLVKEELD